MYLNSELDFTLYAILVCQLVHLAAFIVYLFFAILRDQPTIQKPLKDTSFKPDICIENWLNESEVENPTYPKTDISISTFKPLQIIYE